MKILIQMDNNGFHLYHEYEREIDNPFFFLKQFEIVKNHFEKYNDIFVNNFNGIVSNDGLVYFNNEQDCDAAYDFLNSALLLDKLQEN